MNAAFPPPRAHCARRGDGRAAEPDLAYHAARASAAHADRRRPCGTEASRQWRSPSASWRLWRVSTAELSFHRGAVATCRPRSKPHYTSTSSSSHAPLPAKSVPCEPCCTPGCGGTSRSSSGCTCSLFPPRSCVASATGYFLECLTWRSHR